MADKDVQRNVRSSGEEGIKTPTQKHYHSLGEKDNFVFGEGGTDSAEKKDLLTKFKEREMKWKKGKSPEKTREKQEGEEKS